MALYIPPIKIETVCSCCGYRGDKSIKKENYMPLNNKAIGNCPKCGYFTLCDMDSIKFLENIATQFKDYNFKGVL